MKKECNQILPTLQEYVDRELNAGGRKMVEEHILECKPCRKEILELERLSNIFREKIPQENVPPNLIVSTWKAVEEVGRKAPFFDFIFTPRGFSWSLAMYAVGMFIIVIGYLVAPMERVSRFGDGVRPAVRVSVSVSQTVSQERVGAWNFKDF